MSGKARRLALLLLALSLLSGCAASPPDTLVRSEPAAAQLISADTQGLTADSFPATLYFRYGSTAYLAPEERLLSVQRNETKEKALVQALLDGPAAVQSALSPLFPPGTQVLAAASQGDTLFITFNEALLGRYSDEPSSLSAEPWKTEGTLRRQLCMDALSATLTEAGLCAQVQVLVYREKAQTASMRLHAGFFDRTEDETLLPAFTRNEAALLTPHNTGSVLLTAWMTQDWATLYDLVAREQENDPRPDELAAFDAFHAARTVTSFSLSPGNVASDGAKAVLSAQMTLRSQGEDQLLSGYPLHLVRENGLWKIPYSRLTALMNQD